MNIIDTVTITVVDPVQVVLVAYFSGLALLACCGAALAGIASSIAK